MKGEFIMQEKIVIHICGNPHERIGAIPTTLEQLYMALKFIKQKNLSFERVCIEETRLSERGERL